MTVPRLEDRVAIVTGAGRGIGVAYAKALAAEGAKVCAADIRDTTRTVDIIHQLGGEAFGIEADVTDAAAVAHMVSETVAKFGKVDVLVNNAALFADLSRGHFMDIASDDWDKVMSVTIWATAGASASPTPRRWRPKAPRSAPPTFAIPREPWISSTN